MARLWTLSEANAALPKVRGLLAESRAALAAVRDVDDNLEDLQIVGQSDTQEARDLLVARGGAMRTLERCMKAFDQMGCEVKDVAQGLVDFRGQLGAEVVYLCWRDGEQGITHWHTLEGGFAARKPIPT